MRVLDNIMMSVWWEAGTALEISACGFCYIIQGLLKGGSKWFHNFEPQNFVGSAQPMEPTVTWSLYNGSRQQNRFDNLSRNESKFKDLLNGLILGILVVVSV